MMKGDLSMTAHVNKIVSQCFYSLLKIKSIYRSLSTDSTITLVTSLICFRIDHCNTIFAGVPNRTIDRLENVLHAAARITTGVRNYDHITSTLRDKLHWLPVTQRITFKLCLTVYKALHCMTPYIAEFCHPVVATHYQSQLCSSTCGDLLVPRTCLELDKRALTVADSTIWNNVPLSVRLAPFITTFKTALKMHLFSATYGASKCQ